MGSLVEWLSAKRSPPSPARVREGSPSESLEALRVDVESQVGRKSARLLRHAWRIGGLGVVLLAGTSCCNTHACVPVPAAQKCTLGTPAAPALPRLFRALSKPPASARYPAAPICTSPHSVSEECEVVDDVQAMLGTGYDCVNGADVGVGACEGWTSPSPLRASPADPPCGATACPNLILSARDPAGAPAEVTFYDDISCHRAPREPNCQKSGRACYYRVLRVDHS